MQPDEPVFPEYEIVDSDEVAELELARAQAVADGDADRAWELMSEDEREAAFRRAVATKRAGRTVGAHTPSPPGMAKRRRAAKSARRSRRRNRQ